MSNNRSNKSTSFIQNYLQFTYQSNSPHNKRLSENQFLPPTKRAAQITQKNAIIHPNPPSCAHEYDNDFAQWLRNSSINMNTMSNHEYDNDFAQLINAKLNHNNYEYDNDFAQRLLTNSTVSNSHKYDNDLTQTLPSQFTSNNICLTQQANSPNQEVVSSNTSPKKQLNYLDEIDTLLKANQIEASNPLRIIGKGNFGSVVLYTYKGNNCEINQLTTGVQKFIAIKKQNNNNSMADTSLKKNQELISYYNECIIIKYLAQKNWPHYPRSIVLENETHACILSQYIFYDLADLQSSNLRDFILSLSAKNDIIHEASLAFKQILNNIIFSMYEAQHALHQLNVLHLDTSLRNYVLERPSIGTNQLLKMSLKIIDFGLSKIIDENGVSSISYNYEHNAQFLPLIRYDQKVLESVFNAHANKKNAQTLIVTIHTDLFSMKLTIIEVFARFIGINLDDLKSTQDNLTWEISNEEKINNYINALNIQIVKLINQNKIQGKILTNLLNHYKDYLVYFNEKLDFNQALEKDNKKFMACYFECNQEINNQIKLLDNNKYLSLIKRILPFIDMSNVISPATNQTEIKIKEEPIQTMSAPHIEYNPVLTLNINQLKSVIKILRGNHSKVVSNCTSLAQGVIDYFRTSKLPTHPASIKFSLDHFSVNYDVQNVVLQKIKSKPLQAAKNDMSKEISTITFSSINREGFGLYAPANVEHLQDENGTIQLNKQLIDVDHFTQPSINVCHLDGILKEAANHQEKKISFGIVNLARCDQYVNNPGHMIVYFATPTSVTYIDCQFYDPKQNESLKAAIFKDIKKKFRFAGLQDNRITSNTFSPIIYYTPMGPSILVEKEPALKKV